MIQYDNCKEAILNPKDMNRDTKNISEFCILCFFNDVINKLEKSGKIKKIEELNSTLGKHNIYELNHNGLAINIFNPGLGGPMSAGFLEELISLGVKECIACGGAGVLKSDIKMGEVIVATEAVREEGTSYHYIEHDENILVNKKILKAIGKVLKQNNINYIEGKVWTTDAIYRETRKKIADKKEEGCIAVDMEFASMLAVSLFRNINFGQILYGGDNVSGEIWEYRKWRENEDIQSKIFWLCTDVLEYINKLKKKEEDNESIKG